MVALAPSLSVECRSILDRLGHDEATDSEVELFGELVGKLASMFIADCRAAHRAADAGMKALAEKERT